MIITVFDCNFKIPILSTPIDNIQQTTPNSTKHHLQSTLVNSRHLVSRVAIVEMLLHLVKIVAQPAPNRVPSVVRVVSSDVSEVP